MRNYNRAPKIVALGAAIALGASACTMENGHTEPEPTPTPSTTPSYHGDNIPKKNLTNCKGQLEGFKPADPFETQHGDAYKVTRLVDFPCASVYDTTTLRDFGGLAESDVFIGPCKFESAPPRIHVMAPNMEGDAFGSVNLSEAGLAQAEALKIPTCDLLGIPDKGAFTPHRLIR